MAASMIKIFTSKNKFPIEYNPSTGMYNLTTFLNSLQVMYPKAKDCSQHDTISDTHESLIKAGCVGLLGEGNKDMVSLVVITHHIFTYVKDSDVVFEILHDIMRLESKTHPTLPKTVTSRSTSDRLSLTGFGIMVTRVVYNTDKIELQFNIKTGSYAAIMKYLRKLEANKTEHPIRVPIFISEIMYFPEKLSHHNLMLAIKACADQQKKELSKAVEDQNIEDAENFVPQPTKKKTTEGKPIMSKFLPIATEIIKNSDHNRIYIMSEAQQASDAMNKIHLLRKLVAKYTVLDKEIREETDHTKTYKQGKLTISYRDQANKMESYLNKYTKELADYQAKITPEFNKTLRSLAPTNAPIWYGDENKIGALIMKHKIGEGWPIDTMRKIINKGLQNYNEKHSKLPICIVKRTERKGDDNQVKDSEFFETSLKDTLENYKWPVGHPKTPKLNYTDIVDKVIKKWAEKTLFDEVPEIKTIDLNTVDVDNKGAFVRGSLTELLYTTYDLPVPATKSRGRATVDSEETKEDAGDEEEEQDILDDEEEQDISDDTEEKDIQEAPADDEDCF